METEYLIPYSMLGLMYLGMFIELLLFVQCIRALNRIVKKLDNIDITLIDLYQNLDEDLVLISNRIKDVGHSY